MVSLPEPQKPSETDPAWKPRSTLLGTLLANRYRITGALGQGSTGAVFRADDVLLKRPVAIRILVPKLAQHAPLIAEIRARIEKNTERDPEALVNLVDITDVGMTLEGEVFIATDFLDGDHLSTMLTRGGRLPWSRARSLLIRLGQILHGFHRQGIVVGTLEARHCFAVRAKAKQEAIKIVHNAILEHLAGAIGPTGGHGVAMLARYVAPERICGEPLDARTDVYSLGIIAYELLTGQLPFNDPNPIRLVSMHLQKAPPSPRSLAPDADIPAEVEALLIKCLAKDPADRFPTMEALTDALTAISETADVAPAIPATPVALPISAPPIAPSIAAPPIAAAPIAAAPAIPIPAPAAPLSAVPSANSVPVAAPRIPSTPISARPSASSSAVPAAPSAPPASSGPSPLAMATRPATAPVPGGSITESGKLRLPPPPTLGGPRGTSGPLPGIPTPGARPPSLGLPPPPSRPSAPAPTPVVRAPSIPVPSATLPAGTVAAPVGIPRASGAVPSATLPAGAIPAPAATLPPTGTPVSSASSLAAPAPSTSPLAAPVPPASPLASPVHTTSPFTAASALAGPLAGAVPSASPAPSAVIPASATPVPAAGSPASAAPVPSAILATADMNGAPVEEDPVRLRARIAAFAADEARRKNPLRSVPASAMAETRIGPAPTRSPTPIVDDEPPAPTPIAKPIVATPVAKPVVATPVAKPAETPRLQVVPQKPPEPALTPAASLSDGALDEPPRRRGWLVGGLVGAGLAAGIAALVLSSPSFMAERTRETPTRIAAPIGAIPERAVVTPTKIAEADPSALPERGTAVVAPDPTPDANPAEPTPDTNPAEPIDTKSAEPTDTKSAAVDPPRKTKKKARRNFEFEDEEPREKDVFDQLREHMAAKKAAEEARAAAMAGNSAPSTPAPTPVPAQTEADKARETLDRARVASSNGNHTLAYSLAKQAYAHAKSLDALELMGVSACRSKNADGARSVVGSLTGTRRNAVMIACTQSGITL